MKNLTIDNLIENQNLLTVLSNIEKNELKISLSDYSLTTKNMFFLLRDLSDIFPEFDFKVSFSTNGINLSISRKACKTKLIEPSSETVRRLRSIIKDSFSSKQIIIGENLE